MVLGQHSPVTFQIHPIIDTVPNYLLKNGYLGVDLFFVLSGFLIGGLLFAEFDKIGSINIVRFLTRRALKIWPAYYISLTACCVWFGKFGHYPDGTKPSLEEVFAKMWPAYLHFQNYIPATKLFLWYWSLGVEEHFYFLLPGVLLLSLSRLLPTDSRKIAKRIIFLGLLVTLICLGLRELTILLDPELELYVHYYPTHLRIDSLMAGVVLAAWVRFCPAQVLSLRKIRYLIAALGLGIFALPGVLPEGNLHSVYPFDCFITTLGAICLLLAGHLLDSSAKMNIADAKFLLNCLPFKLLAAIGFYSYSIYLWHGFFGESIAWKISNALHLASSDTGVLSLIHALVYLISMLAVGIGGYYLVEWPFLKFRELICPREKRPLGR
jgi:peptidoglycan/LPS O-acetylase OafA/YrhL